jgi:hypothetical protein
MLLALIPQIAQAAQRPAKSPASQPTEMSNPERLKWENRIIFYGDEATSEWSLRVRDKDVDQQRQFRLRELWQYDRGTKRWGRLGTTVLTSTMVTHDHKRKDPQNPDDDTQILAVLPVDRDTAGLFYAKWTVDDVKGSTYCQIGPGLAHPSPLMHQRPPEGKIFAIVPIDLTHSEAAFIADPRIECEYQK